MDAIFREYPRNEGMPERWIKPLKEVEEIRAARAAQEAEQQRLMQQQMEAQALGETKGMSVSEMQEKAAAAGAI